MIALLLVRSSTAPEAIESEVIAVVPDGELVEPPGRTRSVPESTVSPDAPRMCCTETVCPDTTFNTNGSLITIGADIVWLPAVALIAAEPLLTSNVKVLVPATVYEIGDEKLM